MIVICEKYDPVFYRPISLRAKLLSDLLGLPVVHKDNWRDFDSRTECDTLIFIEGNTLYLPQFMLLWLEDVIGRTKRVVFATADFCSRPPSLFSWRKVGQEFVRWSQFHLPQGQFLNTKIVDWNAVNFAKEELQPTKETKPLYYGTYRKNRSNFFREFLYNTLISTRPSDVDNFKRYAKGKCEFITPISSVEELGTHLATIYALDSIQPCDPGPSQRFYEALAAGIPLAIHTSAIQSLGDLPTDPFRVNDYKQYNSFCQMCQNPKVRQELAILQRQLWLGSQDPLELLKLQIKEAFHGS